MSTFALHTLLVLPSIVLSVFAGRLAVRRRARRSDTWSSSGLESSLIGVFGFLLSFAFFLSGGAHRESLALVHDQVAVLAKLHREADLLSPADAVALRQAVRTVLECEVAGAGASASESFACEAACSRAYDALWLEVGRRSATSADPSRFRAALDDAQEAIALEYRIRFSEIERVPTSFLWLLIAGAALTGFLIGFVCESERHGHLVPVCYVLLSGATLVTIFDLNDPRHGLLQTSRANYVQLLDALGPAPAVGTSPSDGPDGR